MRLVAPLGLVPADGAVRLSGSRVASCFRVSTLIVPLALPPSGSASPSDFAFRLVSYICWGVAVVCRCASSFATTSKVCLFCFLVLALTFSVTVCVSRAGVRGAGFLLTVWIIGSRGTKTTAHHSRVSKVFRIYRDSVFYIYRYAKSGDIQQRAGINLVYIPLWWYTPLL